MIKRVNREEVLLYIEASIDQYTAPPDDMWQESIIPKCDFYELDEGFFALSDGILMAYYSTSDEFEKVLSEMNVEEALVSTYDPIFYSECVKHLTKEKVDTLLYREGNIKEMDVLEYQVAAIDQLDEVLDYFKMKHHDDGDWLKPYLIQLIEKKGLYLFYQNELVGTGEIRKSGDYANIGVSVSSDHRRRGIGKRIVHTLSQICRSKGIKTICSTTVDNTASRRMLESCGYENYHNIYRVTFKRDNDSI